MAPSMTSSDLALILGTGRRAEHDVHHAWHAANSAGSTTRQRALQSV